MTGAGEDTDLGEQTDLDGEEPDAAAGARELRPAGLGSFGVRLAVVVAAGFAWRLVLLVATKWDQPLLFNDSIYYSAWAEQLTEGRFFREVFYDGPTAEHGPLTSVLMAPLSWPGDPVPYQRLVTLACGTATIAVIGLLGRAVRGERVGLVAATLAAGYANLWINDGLVMSESVSMLAISLVLLQAHRMIVGGRRGLVAAAVLGALCALAGLARTELILFVPLLVALLLVDGREAAPPPRERWRVSAALVAAAVITLLPWVVPNLVRFERPALLTTNAGTTLIGSYCDRSFFGPNKGGWTIECVFEHPTFDTRVDPSVRDPRQRDAAIEYAQDHLGELPKVVAARVMRTLDLFGLDTLLESDVGDERPRWAAWTGIVSWWILAPLAIGGWLLLPRRTKLLLATPALIVLSVVVVFYGGHRIRSSLEPSVVVCAAVALVAAWERFAGRAQQTGGRPVGSTMPVGGSEQ